MKRLLALLVAGALAAGCSGSGETTAGGGAIRGELRLTAAGGEGEIRALQGLVDAFEASYPEVEVTLDAVASPGDLVTKLTTGFAGRTAPDVFLMNYRRLGGFLPQVEQVTGVDTAAYYPASVAAFTQGGALRCLPQNASSLVVYLNPALFGRAGVDVPTPEWTWDDLLATARALAAKNVKAIGFDPELIRLAPFVWSAGGEVVDDPDEPTVVDLGGRKARRAIQFLLDLQKTGLNATDRAARSAEDTFAAGGVAMYLDSRRAVPGLRKIDALDFDVRPLPRGSAGSISVLHADGYCVTRSAKNPAAARAFARFAAGSQGATVLTRSGRTVPSLRSIADSPTFLDGTVKPLSSRVFLDQLPTVRVMPASPHWNDAEGAASDVLAQLFAGKKSIDQAIAEIRQRSKAELAVR